ncbi:serine hydrolase domain-containing protein [Roseivirga seohaensis]|uniref:serine hydrolase domain-containing protein n=1 Tax=Roseivirga seohaensis TaxID=1914963 RepID=UPI00069CEE53|nr:serine hydrolase domain-containing protein [Roseivirga seohaensis]
MKVFKTSGMLMIVMLALTNNFSFAQSKFSKKTQQKIEAVESNLAASTMTKEQPTWTLQERMETYNVQGLSIAVIDGGEIQWTKGYGFTDVASKTKVESNTLFQAASISKSLNAMAILKLAQDQEINLDADINDYLSTWKFPYESGNKPISTAHLLSHTAGLNVHGFPGYTFEEPKPSVIQILNGESPSNTEAIKSLFEPGIRYQYSGGGTLISQLILEDVTHKKYSDFLKEKVLSPLQMNNSFFGAGDPKKGSMFSTAYENDGTEVEGKFHIYPELAAAGLWTTPTDLAKFIIEMQLSAKNQSNKVLNQDFTKLMLSPFIESSDISMGTFIEKHGEELYFTHSGANWGFNCIYIGGIENGKGVVIMANSDNPQILYEIVTSVTTVYGWEGYDLPEIKDLYPVSDDQLNEYVGEYSINEQIKINIATGDKVLMLTLPGRPAFEIYPESKDKFFPIALPGQIEFVRNDKNEIIKLIVHANGSSTSANKTK